MKQTRTQRLFREMCADLGCVPEYKGRGRHDKWVVTRNGVSVKITSPVSPSDNRWLMNSRAYLRRALVEQESK